MKKFFNISVFSFLASCIFLVLISFCFLYLCSVPTKENRTSFIIKSGLSATEIGNLLESDGIIRDRHLFNISYLVMNRLLGKVIMAGEYSFYAGENIFDILRKLFEGKTISHKILIPEGIISTQVVCMVNSGYGILNEEKEYEFKNGELMPDTYVYKYGNSSYDIISRMKNSMTKFLDEEWNNIDESILDVIKNKQDVVTLASILEKESRVDAEKPMIASVYINRLRKGMKLDADPSVIFAINSGNNFGIRLFYKDLRIQSPYNTYINKGLPPGPICNPGRASISAVLRPSKSNYLYFVSDNSGTHRFAKNFSEHIANVKLYKEARQLVGVNQPNKQ
ncbi:putative MltG-like endolytic transglycosylase [Candidatus Cyrtobacter comes]|uniref:Endolytic murein transglycosylase n=1 Tax=Candidatus Cyrtobacter comes TaxID=675776 RepID=A0ABU5L7S8_9RICK|nr:endolytic transglycosylase MltG [Candidatus Cyrtobacter comes]MDZ5762180.1 putative MltG-like endolytic transglycosylase [Candidatus Cyrtobacter comes]